MFSSTKRNLKLQTLGGCLVEVGQGTSAKIGETCWLGGSCTKSAGHAIKLNMSYAAHPCALPLQVARTTRCYAPGKPWDPLLGRPPPLPVPGSHHPAWPWRSTVVSSLLAEPNTSRQTWRGQLTQWDWTSEGKSVRCESWDFKWNCSSLGPQGECMDDCGSKHVKNMLKVKTLWRNGWTRYDQSSFFC